MRKRVSIAACTLGIILGAAIPVQAQHSSLDQIRAEYQTTYEKVDKANAGPYEGGVAGRNIADDGVLTKSGPKPATATELKDGISVMSRMLNPPAPAPVATTTTSTSYSTPTTTTTTVAPTTSSGGCPSYMAGEASSPSAVNASSGAAGCFQVTPGTQAAMGSACSDVNSSSCVSAICASQGNAAWSSSGATPCDYISEP